MAVVTGYNRHPSVKLRDVDVKVNKLNLFVGKKIGDDLYVPFTFLRKFYEIGGDFVTVRPGVYAKPLEFSWSHTNSIINPYELNFKLYTTSGVYLSFDETDVAIRSRVKAISGEYEVPVTTQWDVRGYYYPIQIAQYGLSHLSKLYKDQKEYEERVIDLTSEGSRIKIAVNEKEKFIVKIKMERLTPFIVQVFADDGKKYTLRYNTEKTFVRRKTRIITYGLGMHLRKNTIVRDLNVDLVKGLSFIEGKKQGKTVDIKVVKLLTILFKHISYVEKLSLVQIDHVAKFTAAADWLVHFQDDVGGWKNNVSRTVIKGILNIKPGWYSAMGQGQAISLLCRVYSHTKDKKYLIAAVKATKVFNIPSEQNGVLAVLFGKYPWYEEYPTTPSLFVLNGFIYSLLGLYDLSKTIEDKEAERLFQQGFESLENVLPVYDNGHGSFYDLRHFSVPGFSPNIARWQYHRVHLELLDAIVGITGSKSINSTLHRWINYAAGILARHN